MRHVPICLALLLATTGAHAADNWADTAGNNKDYAASKAICVKAKSVSLPTNTPASPKDCDSSALLYGIERPSDPAAARACAVRETRDEADNPSLGFATLATIYANGRGVARNYDFAIAYACLIDGAPAEMDGRVKHLARLKAAGADKAPFDFCDDVTSGMMEGFCAEREGDLANARRKVEIASLLAGLDAPARAAFAKLEQAEKAFVKAAADNEVDVSGTARGMLIVGSQQGHEDGFMTALRSTLAGKVTGGGTAKEADKRLNATYAKVMALKDTSGLGTVDKKGIKDTQRAWLGYRDAFIAFAKAAAPAVPADALAA